MSPHSWFNSRHDVRARRNVANLRLEALEDRLAPADLIHVYELNGSFADQMGGPALAADGGTLGDTRYTFGPNQGLSLTGALPDTADYSVVLVMQVDLSTGGAFKKVIDFSDLTSDNGLYVSGSTLQLFPGNPGSNSITSNTDFQVVLARDGATGETRVFLNGVLQQVYLGEASDAAIVISNILTFFEDDAVTGGSESFSGSVDRILIYDGAFDPTADQNHPPTVTVDNEFVAVNEGQLASNTGTWSDPDFDPVSLMASVGTILQDADGSWLWSFPTSDGPDQSQTVAISATDSHGASAATSFSLIVNNVAPFISTGSGADHDYELNGSLADALGGPSLVADGGTLGSDGYVFGPNQGLTLTGALADPSSYTIFFVATLDDVDDNPLFKKLLDFANLSMDEGLYVRGANLELFPGGAGPDSISADTPFQVALTRDGLTGEAKVYLNGVLQRTHVGDPSDSAVAFDNILRFFEDDIVTGRSEAVGGSVDRILVFNSALTAERIANLGNAPPPVTEVVVNEGETATVTGFWRDPGDDEVSLSASVGSVVKNADGTWSWSFNAQDPDQSQTVVITATDSDGASSTTSYLLSVNNLPPSVAADNANVSVDEGQTATNTGVWSDPGAGGDVTLSASVGTVTKNADGTWSWSFAAQDGPAQSQTVLITATDSDGATASASFSLVVNNVAPVIVSLTAGQPSSDGNVSIAGAFQDAGVLDTHTVTVAWGDGSPMETLSVDQAADTVAGSHHYAQGGEFTITVTVTDNDGGAALQSTTVVTSGASLVNGRLFVFGTNEADQVEIDLVQMQDGLGAMRNTLQVQMRLDGVDSVAFFDAAEVGQIVVIASGGDDRVRIDRRVHIDAFLFGGAGDDDLRGGNGANLLDGGAGDDILRGGDRADILIGGEGMDWLFGGGGDDLLVGGSAVNADNLDALTLALSLWQFGDLGQTLDALGGIIDDGQRDQFIGQGGNDTIIEGGYSGLRRAFFFGKGWRRWSCS